MKPAPGTFILSPFVSIWPAGFHGQQKARVTDALTGRTYQLGDLAIELMRTCATHHTIPGIAAQTGLSEQDAETALLRLAAQKFLITDTNYNEFTWEFTSVTPTLFGWPSKPTSLRNQDERIISFAGVPFGKGNSHSVECAKFPEELRRLTRNYNLNTGISAEIDFSFLNSFRDYSRLSQRIERGLLVDEGNMFLPFEEKTESQYRKIEALAGRLFSRQGCVPVFLGGDHAITAPLVIAAARNLGPIDVLHIDAHTDDYDSPAEKIFSDDRMQHHHANFINRLLADENVHTIIHAGVRGAVNRHATNSEKKQIWWIGQVREMIRNRELKLSHTDRPLYVSIDMDVLDPIYMQATPSPVAGGLTPEELFTFLELALKNRNVAGADIVEVYPMQDQQNVSIQYCIQLLMELCNLI